MDASAVALLDQRVGNAHLRRLSGVGKAVDQLFRFNNRQ
jgi:hypothetical protein